MFMIDSRGLHIFYNRVDARSWSSVSHCAQEAVIIASCEGQIAKILTYLMIGLTCSSNGSGCTLDLEAIGGITRQFEVICSSSSSRRCWITPMLMLL